MHMMLKYIVRLNGSECTQSHMKSHISCINTLFLKLLKKFGRKMKSCRGCRSRTVVFGVNGLVPVPVLKLMGYIRRKRHLPEPVQNFLKNSIVTKLYKPVALFKHFHYLTLKKSVTEAYLRSRPELFTRLDKSLPHIIRKAFEQKDLNMRSCIILDTEKPCGYDPCIVKYQTVTAVDMFTDVSENVMSHASAFLIKQQKTR